MIYIHILNKNLNYLLLTILLKKLKFNYQFITFNLTSIYVLISILLSTLTFVQFTIYKYDI